MNKEQIKDLMTGSHPQSANALLGQKALECLERVEELEQVLRKTLKAIRSNCFIIPKERKRDRATRGTG